MTAWPDPPPPHHVHLWMCGEVTDPRCEAFIPHLGPDEQERAAAFRFDPDRRRFVGARFLLRRVLGHYLDVAPQDLQFAAGEWGKPTLAAAHRSALSFNLSRSHQVALLAVSGAGEVGVDVEFHREDRADPLIVKRQFSEPEQEYIARSSHPKAAFYEIWTRKEAYIKAIGRGLHHPLREFSVAPEGCDLCTRVHDWSKRAAEQCWHVQNLNLALAGYPAALSTRTATALIETVQVSLEDLSADRVS